MFNTFQRYWVPKRLLIHQYEFDFIKLIYIVYTSYSMLIDEWRFFGNRPQTLEHNTICVLY